MRIVSTELRQVFRAYTKQLRGEYDRAKSSVGRESVAKGFEKVDISPEAQAALARSLSEEPPPVAEFEADANEAADASEAGEAPESPEAENREKSIGIAKVRDPYSRSNE